MAIQLETYIPLKEAAEKYSPGDIRNALLAAEQAVNATADATGNEDDPFSAGFLTGYRAALTYAGSRHLHMLDL